MKTSIITRIIDTPAGKMILGSYEDKLCLCDWVESQRRDSSDYRIQRFLKSTFTEGSSPVIEQTIVQLDEYFASKRKIFDIPLLFTGTEFQCRVWNELLRIPYGTTISYSYQASRIGRPTALRAVASANGSNPISIIVPCHRVVGKTNKLVGYAGGLGIKEFLLNLENGNCSRKLLSV